MLIYIVIILLLVYIINKNKQQIEHYWDITPYPLHYDIFKCLDMRCVRATSYKCNRWCDKWPESGGRENCRLRCMDYADQQADYIKFNTYNFYKILPKFKKHALYNYTDIVLE